MPDRVIKFLKSLDEVMKRRLKKKLLEVKNCPFGASGVKKLRSLGKNVYRVRVGKIRIIYKIVHGDIEVVDIDYRGEVYKKK